MSARLVTLLFATVPRVVDGSLALIDAGNIRSYPVYPASTHICAMLGIEGVEGGIHRLEVVAWNDKDEGFMLAAAQAEARGGDYLEALLWPEHVVPRRPVRYDVQVYLDGNLLSVIPLICRIRDEKETSSPE